MRISFNTYNYAPINFKGKSQRRDININRDIQQYLQPLTQNKKAKVSPLSLMKGINPNNNAVFETFAKIYDVTHSINFEKSFKAWNECLMEEIEEFNVAKREYDANKSIQNYDHMEEEMGDILFTAASMAKNAGIDPKEAFKSTNRKFFNRINIMERMAADPQSSTPNLLKDCKPYERRALWNAAKRKIYDAQSLQYNA